MCGSIQDTCKYCNKLRQVVDLIKVTATDIKKRTLDVYVSFCKGCVGSSNFEKVALSNEYLQKAT